MAEAATTRFSSDYGLATTGVAGPEGSEGKPVGELHVAVFRRGEGQGDGKLWTRSLRFPAVERNWIRERAAFAALSLLFTVLNDRND